MTLLFDDKRVFEDGRHAAIVERHDAQVGAAVSIAEAERSEGPEPAREHALRGWWIIDPIVNLQIERVIGRLGKSIVVRVVQALALRVARGVRRRRGSRSLRTAYLKA